MKQKLKLSLITLGCNKNQTDSEFLIKGLSKHFEITHDLSLAEIIILSPCSFLKSARAEAKIYINKLKKFKTKNCRCLVVTGCYAELLKDEIFEKNQDVDLVLGFLDVEKFVKAIKKFFEKNKLSEKRKYVFGKDVFGLFGEKNVERIHSHPNFAYVKISEGCDNKCSYCLIPTIRGDYRSRNEGVILKECEQLLGSGVKELNIVSQDIGAYGVDFGEKKQMSSLLQKIERFDSHFWIRLLYMHPKHIDKNLANLIRNSEKICKYIDIPIQHINNEILEKMNRKITKNEIIDKILLLKETVKNIVIRTTFIVGFPGESDDSCAELADFIKLGYFDKVGFFKYSREKLTPSYQMKNHVPEKIKDARVEKLYKIQEKISFEKNKKFINQKLDFLPEEIISDQLVRGRVFSMAPEVDGDVYLRAAKKFDARVNFNDFIKIQINAAKNYDLYAKEVKK